jgi:hypothetical protein
MGVDVGSMSLLYRIVSTKKVVGNTRNEGRRFFPGPNKKKREKEKRVVAHQVRQTPVAFPQNIAYTFFLPEWCLFFLGL